MGKSVICTNSKFFRTSAAIDVTKNFYRIWDLVFHLPHVMDGNVCGYAQPWRVWLAVVGKVTVIKLFRYVTSYFFK